MLFRSTGIKFERFHEEAWDIAVMISRYQEILSPIGYFFKGTKIFFENSMARESATRINKEIFELCFYNLLENVMKYSYGKVSKKKVEGYNPEDITTSGHVHILLHEDEQAVYISITNWGCPISEVDNIFEELHAPQEVKQFLRKENRNLQLNTTKIELWQGSHRIGLRATKKFIEEIEGSCYCEAYGDKVTFILKNNKPII